MTRLITKRLIRWLVMCSLLMATGAFANDHPPIAQCQSLLTMSADSFKSAVKNDAGSISKALSSCEKYNVCAQLDGIEHCSAVLFNRGFDSDLAYQSQGIASANVALPSSGATQNVESNDVQPIQNVTTNAEQNKNGSSPSPVYVGGNQEKKQPQINWF